VISFTKYAGSPLISTGGGGSDWFRGHMQGGPVLAMIHEMKEKFGN